MTILGNLIDNAVDAVADQPAPRQVSVTITDASSIVIVVADTGPGVPTEHLTDIFVDGYSTKALTGDRRRGIGLALVRRVVNRAGGAITVTPGPGGRFEVTLPGVEVPA
jgi:two-component system CitB family sensor kinase